MNRFQFEGERLRETRFPLGGMGAGCGETGSHSHDPLTPLTPNAKTPIAKTPIATTAIARPLMVKNPSRDMCHDITTPASFNYKSMQ